MLIRQTLTTLLGAAAVLAALPASTDETATTRQVTFTDSAEAAGVIFRHVNGPTPEKYMPETMGAGGLFFDYDNDGWLDIFLVTSGALADSDLAGTASHGLFHGRGDGTFLDVTAGSGLARRGYPMGACAADFDKDGWTDLYVTSFGPNALFRNNGDGTFTDVTTAAGVSNSLWGTSCAFADTDNDGDLDLYVVNYVDFSLDNNKFCGDLDRGIRAYCHPHAYNGLPDVLFRNNGDGTFTDVSGSVGVSNPAGKGLGVVFTDYNDDGWIDIYVANDSVPNFLYRNRGNGSFEEVGLWSGVASNGAGRPEAGMGADAGDFDGDGRMDLFVTNLDMETNTIYRNLGAGLFSDVTEEAGLGATTLRHVGFGTAFFDYDNDGDLDLLIANGHIIDNITEFRQGVGYAERNLLYQNTGHGVFREVGLSAGPGMALEKVSRGLAVGDVDNDGDLDVLITNSGQTADLLLNQGGNRNHSLLVEAVGTRSNPQGVGALLKLTTGGKAYLREIRAGSSYLGQGDLRGHFGLGAATHADQLEIRWPGGAVDTVEGLEAGHLITVAEGKGVVRMTPFQGLKPRTEEQREERRKQ